nr:MAG TPA: protein of unknown function DUF393 [Crassvirales sp.]
MPLNRRIVLTLERFDSSCSHCGFVANILRKLELRTICDRQA